MKGRGLAVTFATACFRPGWSSVTMERLRQAGFKRIGFAFSEDNVLRVDGIWRAVYLLHHAQVRARERVPLFMPWLFARSPEAADRVRFAQVNFSGDESAVCGVDQHHELVGVTALEMVAAQLQHNELGIPISPKVVQTKGRWLDASETRRPGKAGTASA